MTVGISLSRERERREREERERGRGSVVCLSGFCGFVIDRYVQILLSFVGIQHLVNVHIYLSLLTCPRPRRSRLSLQRLGMHLVRVFSLPPFSSFYFASKLVF